MLGKVTCLSSIEVQPTESRIQFVASKDYLINCSNISKLKVYNTTDSEIEFKLDRHEDRTFTFKIFVDETCIVNKKKRFEIKELILTPTIVGMFLPQSLRERLSMFMGGLISQIHVTLRVIK